MFIKLMFALLVMVTVGYAVVGIDRENPPAERFARREVDNLRGFVFSVNRFAVNNHSFDGAVNWAGGDNHTALREQTSTPPALRGVAMPPAWRAIVKQGDFLLCATLSEAAIAILGTELPDSMKNTVVQTGNGSAVVFAEPGDFQTQGGNPAATQEWVNTCSS